MNNQANLAFVFPGQGSQVVGMLSALAKESEIIGATFNEASGILGYDLWDVCQNGPDAKLNNTITTQPALLTACVALWKLWREKSDRLPVLFAGHSLGEYTALVCADALKFEQAVEIVAERGKFMQTAVPAGLGAMAAIIGLEDEAVVKICNESSGAQIVSAANYNSPGQVVISGHKEAVERAVENAKTAGAKRSIILPVSVPSHCALMQSAAEKLADRIKNIEISIPGIPVIHNIDCQPRMDPDEIKNALVKQLYLPVRWSQTILTMQKNGISHIIECGPGKVLCGLIKRIDRQINTISLSDSESFMQAVS